MINEINKEIKQLEARISYLKKTKNLQKQCLMIYNLKVDKIKILNKFRKFGITENVLFAKSRKQEIFYLRSMFIYLICKKYNMTIVSKEICLCRDSIKNSILTIKNLQETKDVKYYNTFKMICLE